MGHSTDLLQEITQLLLTDYPLELGYKYIYEKAIANATARMHPDVIVELDNDVVCVVEIGYTRPEKLTEYQEMGIPDVRWYDKNATLHIHYRSETAPNDNAKANSQRVAVEAVAEIRSAHQKKTLKHNDVRAALMATFDGVIAGTVSPQKAHAVAALSSEYHKSLQQEWDMRVYAAERLTIGHENAVNLLDFK